MENMERILKEAFEVAFLLANQTSFFGPTKVNQSKKLTLLNLINSLIN